MKKIQKISVWQMFIVSMAALYLELFLIRWIGTEVRVFSFVQNIILITCFLGFGVGCLDKDGKPPSMISSLKNVCILAIMVGIPMAKFGIFRTALDAGSFMSGLSNFLTLHPDTNLWGFQDIPFSSGMFLFFSATAAVLVSLLLWLIASSMIPLGRWVGHCFDHSPNTIKAYSANLAGSLVGTWLLLGLAWMNLAPVYWATLAFLLILAAAPTSRKEFTIGIVFLVITGIILLFCEPGPSANGTGVYWSPYQKLEVIAPNKDAYAVRVNNVGYMTIAKTKPDEESGQNDSSASYKDSSYNSPFRFMPPAKDVLIVGAGAGNDVAAALQNGAEHIDAVEIDPVIYQIGKKLHPEHPYESDKVRIVINDARNFMRSDASRYDAIIFGLLDLQTVYSGYSNMRVDNYVYTKDAFMQARRLLKPNGVLVLKFEVRPAWSWIGQRFNRTLFEVFGHLPIVYRAPTVDGMWGASVFLETNGSDLWHRAGKSDTQALLAKFPVSFSTALAEAPAPATDDWPYSYNRDRSIPNTYLTVLVIVLLISLIMVRDSFAYREKRTWTPFLLGTGFMLVETQLISRLTLYFGTTWIVNAIAISTVLCTLVLANLLVERLKKNCKRSPFYVLLVLSLVANYFFPWEQLTLAGWITGLLLSGAYAVSVFMAGIIFSLTLKESGNKSQTLGANVIGAVVGGMLQNASFIFGLKALLLIAAISYTGAAIMDGNLKSKLARR